jgi:hypothetical protein
VRLQPEKRNVQIGERVRFWAKLSRPRSGLLYEFRDADGTVIKSGVDQTEAVGQFWTPGPHRISVFVRIHGPPLTDSTTINVSPPEAGQPVPNLPGPLRVQLSADKPHARVGETVTFTISTVPDLPHLDYQFDAGDGSPMQRGRTPRIQHSYTNPRKYMAKVSLRGAELPARAELAIFITPTATATPSPSPTTTATPPLEVYLSVDKNPNSVGEGVTFSISTNKNKPHLYELNFRDNSGLLQTKSNSVRHIFKNSGNYIVSVRVLDGRFHPRAELEVIVGWSLWHRILTIARYVALAALRPPWLYMVGGLVIVTLCYLFARPTFHPRWDRGVPQKQQENVTINYELHFDPNISKGRQRLETGEASLIISRKKKQ